MNRNSFLVIGLLILFVAGCTTPPSPVVWTPYSPPVTPLPPPQEERTSLPSPTPAATIQPGADSGNINPLTGLAMPDTALLERRPVLVKVSNYPRTGRPHAGLSAADIVFEYYIGYGFNRFLGIYYGEDAEMVGPVRSGRLVDAQIAELYRGLFFFGNADKRVEEILFAELGPRALAERDIPAPPKIRLPDTDLEINLFVDTAALSRYYTANALGENKRMDLSGLVFSPAPPAGSQEAHYLGVQFSRQARGEWRYDPNTGTYLRWIETGPGNSGEPIPMTELLDRENGRQIGVENVILVFATYEEINPLLHDIALFSQTEGNRAVLFRDGQAWDALWKTPNNSHPIQFFHPDGTPLLLKPGKSWIILVGDTSSLETSQGDWELRFDIP